MWIANVCCVSALHGQVMVAIEPNRPSRYLLVGTAEPFASAYAEVYERALLDGRPVLVAVDQSAAVAAAARQTAKERGWHFCIAGIDEGFRPGLHELVLKSGRLVYRERIRSLPADSPVGARCGPTRSGCGP